ncbi:helix-turn-helix domain-containing protein [Streptomyces buecherae]|uniref:helix-turn-helix domain-containing protein n=1 Tax=Streptomyces buecherae TaxID=2763006 RepID=UPI003658C14C
MKNVPTFGEWLRDRLIARGYDLGPRGGGRSRFAEHAGISPPTVGRLLRGDHAAADMRVLAAVADALDVPFVDVLTHARVLTADDVEAIRRHAPAPPTLTPEQAADGLGIVDPEPRRVFLATVAALRPLSAATERHQQQE